MNQHAQQPMCKKIIKGADQIFVDYHVPKLDNNLALSCRAFILVRLCLYNEFSAKQTQRWDL